jgi:hypothetical protein
MRFREHPGIIDAERKFVRLTKETEQIEQTKPRDQPEIDSSHELLVLQIC